MTRWILLLATLLILATGVLFLTRTDQTTNPRADSYLQTGTRAFRVLLDQEAGTVSHTDRYNVNLSQYDLVILPTRNLARNASFNAVLVERLESFVREGGRVLLVSVPEGTFEGLSRAQTYEFLGDSFEVRTVLQETNRPLPGALEALPQQVAPDEPTPTDETEQNHIEEDDRETAAPTEAQPFTRELPSSSSQLFANEPMLGIRLSDQHPAFHYVQLVNDGGVFRVSNAAYLTNFMLADADNAAFALHNVRWAAGTSDLSDVRILIWSADLRGRPGIAESLGPWATAFQIQFLIVLVLVWITYGRRFGPPMIDYQPQRGARELVDALAENLRSSKRGSIGLKWILVEADERIRRIVRLGPGKPLSEARDRLPAELWQTYQDATVYTQRTERGGNIARLMAQKLLSEVEKFESDSRLSG